MPLTHESRIGIWVSSTCVNESVKMLRRVDSGDDALAAVSGMSGDAPNGAYGCGELVRPACDGIVPTGYHTGTEIGDNVGAAVEAGAAVVGAGVFVFEWVPVGDLDGETDGDDDRGDTEGVFVPTPFASKTATITKRHNDSFDNI